MASIDIFDRKALVPEWMAKWWEFDRDFSAKVMAGDWTKMRKEDVIYGSIQGILAVAIAACGAIGENRKPTELPPMGQVTIGLVTQETAGNDALLNQQLAGVKNLSGRADCQPQLVLVDGGNLGAETMGLCQVDTEFGKQSGTQVVVRGQKNGEQQTINQMLVARSHLGTNGKPDTLYFEYGSGNQKETLFEYDVASGGTEWILPDGKMIEFKKGQSPFEAMIGKILDPGNVAAAAEATQVYDPTKPAIVTLTPDGNVTVTQEPAVAVLDISGPGDEILLTDKMPGAFFVEKDGNRYVGEKVLDESGKVVAVQLAVPDKLFWKGTWYQLNSEKSNQYVAVYGENGEVGVARQIAIGDAGNVAYIKNDGKGGAVAMLNGRRQVVMGESGYEGWIYDSGQRYVVLGDGTWVNTGPEPKPKPEVVVVKPADPAPTATVGTGEGGLPPGAVRFDEGGIKGIRSPVPIPDYKPRFSNGYGVADCRVSQSCNEITAFDSLQEAEAYWQNTYPKAMFRYTYWFFDDGGIARVFVQLTSTGN